MERYFQEGDIGRGLNEQSSMERSWETEFDTVGGTSKVKAVRVERASMNAGKATGGVKEGMESMLRAQRGRPLYLIPSCSC